MPTATTNAACLNGVEAIPVHVECDISVGNFYFGVVGLPESEVKESRERVNSAISNTVGSFPLGRVIVNLSPADIRKSGTGFDLPIALSVLAANGNLPTHALTDFLFVGELSLTGELRPLPGILSISMATLAQKIPNLVVPEANAYEASFIKNVRVFSAKSLKDIIVSFKETFQLNEIPYHKPQEENVVHDIDFSDVKGQQKAKRAMEIAAAGRHNILFRGPPGSGKSMLAKCLNTIMPPMTEQEMVEVTKIHSVSGLTSQKTFFNTGRPFRSPHHTISNAGLIGGGPHPKPGEISLAHHGVIFLDELPEFPRQILELMRQPMEDRTLVIARAGISLRFPANFLLIAAMNPCPCGYYGDPTHTCSCTPGQIHRYRTKISGPLMDRIDIQIELPNVSYREMNFKKKGESSSDVRARVMGACRVQYRRFPGKEITNSMMSRRNIELFCRLDSKGHAVMEAAMKNMGFSNRAHDRILKIARTIADLGGAIDILPEHISEAVNYRMFG